MKQAVSKHFTHSLHGDPALFQGHRESQAYPPQKVETPQADDEQTRTVSTEICSDFALLDKKLSMSQSREYYGCLYWNRKMIKAINETLSHLKEV